MLKDEGERFGLPLALYQEAEHFLRKLDRAGLGTTAGEAE